MIIRFIANALALAVAAWLVPGITLSASTTSQKGLALAIVAVIFGVVNALVKPVFEAVTGCFILITFGLFLWVINACMLKLTGWVAGQVGLGFTVDNWTAAFIGALIVSIVSALVSGAWRRTQGDRQEHAR